ncbi:MAG: M48 family metalloprotease [Rhodospirillaceae bacterium]|nr:M48 family metalloprotease [Rhodospirillales bacterium]
MPLNSAILARHHRRNRLQSLLIMAGIGGWMALIGWLVVGPEGIVWAVVGTVLVLLVQPVRSTTLLKALYGAVPLAPAEAPGLHGLMRELSVRAGLDRVPPLLYIPRRELVALSTGWGADGAIALSDGMLRHLPGRELAAVLAHETSHLRSGDLKLLRLAEAAGRLTRMLSLLGLLLILIYLPALNQSPTLALALLVFAPMVNDLLTLKLSRTREFDADTGGAELTGDPDGLIRALTRIERLQGGNWERLMRGPGLKWFNWIRTHPTTGERVERLRELAPQPLPQWLSVPQSLLMPSLLGLPPAPRWWWPGRR